MRRSARSSVSGTEDSYFACPRRFQYSTSAGSVISFQDFRTQHKKATTHERGKREEFLRDYRGYLQADAYAAYDSSITNPERGLAEIGYMSQETRYFRDSIAKLN
jgi:hypothetical protein